MCAGILRGLFFAALPIAIHGLIFYAFSQVSHVQAECFRDDHCDEQRHDRDGAGRRRQEGGEGGGGDDGVGGAAGGEGGATCPGENGRSGGSLGKDWAADQVSHTADYNTQSLLWLHLSNGLNNQIVHHLFPQVDWSHYPPLAAIVEVTAREYGVRHTVFPTFFAALCAHVRHLVRINDVRWDGGGGGGGAAAVTHSEQRMA
jgi:hypothetical protein